MGERGEIGDATVSVAVSRTARFLRVAGFCPMGCGATLFLGAGGHVTCSYLPCPDPCAADNLLRVQDKRGFARTTTTAPQSSPAPAFYGGIPGGGV